MSPAVRSDVSESSMDDSLELHKGRSRISQWRQHLSEEADEAWGDLILIVACFISGLVDSAVFNVWSCFVSMQTGEPSGEERES